MRHTNGGIRKICACPRRAWTKCAHPWHFNYKPRGGPSYRFSLDAHLNKHVDSKTDAEAEAALIKAAIKAGTFGAAAPQLDNLTVGQLLDTYYARYVQSERKDSVRNVAYQIAKIKRTDVERLDGRLQSLGEWRMADVTADTLDRFKETRRNRGPVTANRDLAFLSACFNWAIRKRHIKESPFKLGSETIVKLSKEHPRTRRLHDDEEAALLAACGPHLRSVVEAAIETGCRKGEILTLQWKQVEGMRIEDDTVTWAPKAELFLPFCKTKTKTDRRIPISTRLKAILEMRRFDPAGQPHAADRYVFGTDIGGRLLGFERAWHAAVLRAHGYTPTRTSTANLTPESRAALKSIALHFHDLRREAGSRWMDGGVPIATIQRWLGHSNVSQTSTYLAGTQTSEHDALARYEARRTTLQRLATDVERGVQTGAQTAGGHDTRPNKTAAGRELGVM